MEKYISALKNEDIGDQVKGEEIWQRREDWKLRGKNIIQDEEKIKKENDKRIFKTFWVQNKKWGVGKSHRNI